MRRLRERQLETEIADLRERVEALEGQNEHWSQVSEVVGYAPYSVSCDQNCAHCELTACPYPAARWWWPVNMYRVTYNTDRWGNVWLT